MFTPEKSLLVVIDIQGTLAHLMAHKKKLIANTSRLIRAASILKIPTLVTEQVPDKLGPTVPEISECFDDFWPIAKSSFSCYGEPKFSQMVDSMNRKEIVLAGIETHVCVYQTARDLIDKGYQVQVVGDATSSRTAENKHYALEHIKHAGGGVTSVEMIVCEWLRGSQHPQFKSIINLIK